MVSENRSDVGDTVPVDENVYEVAPESDKAWCNNSCIILQ
jgi:hypothetical protein